MGTLFQSSRTVFTKRYRSAMASLTFTENEGKLQDMIKSLLPPLNNANHKGEAGRVGIVGGCSEYTGAPYFAAISSLRVGCDLSHVFCAKEAATVIKSYSPELIVHSLLDVPEKFPEIENWMQRLHSLVIGPGLGRDPQLLGMAKRIIHRAKEMSLPVIIDADGLHIVNEDPSIVKASPKVILTPNAVEFGRLHQTVASYTLSAQFTRQQQPLNPLGRVAGDIHEAPTVSTLAAALHNITIVLKGEMDIIGNGTQTLICNTKGSSRRCGGQGDLLSGSLGTFTHWGYKQMDNPSKHDMLTRYGPNICAAYAACHLTKLCNYNAFQKYHRSMMTTDMIQEIPDVMHQNFGE